MRGKIIGWLFCVLVALGAVESLQAQGTAFTYQGRLNAGGSPASGNYDLTFALYNSTSLASTNLAGPITNSAVTVTNGLFTTALDFGPGVFTGTNYWLQIGVRTNGDTSAFTTLSPRQPLTPTPYAIFANTASNLSGTLPSAQLSGTYSDAVMFNNSANSFSGNGTNLVNLNASQLTGGTVADARLSANVALLNGNQTFSGVNTFTNPGNSFRGSFFGNGLVGWITVSNTAQQAARDTGYMLTSPFFTTVTLPPTSGLTNGDIVRISGAGGGGWQAKVNSGQSFIGNLANYDSSYLVALQSTTYANNYSDVAASVDGTRMYAVGNGITGISASSDSGRTWNQVGTLSGNWQSIACSANGRIVYAVSTTGGIQMSGNSGATWSTISGSATTIACTADGSEYFTGGIACSGNGTYLAKLIGGAINISTNAGSSWFSIPAPAAGLSCVAVSSDCTRLVAGVSGGLLYGSANVGVTWTAITTTNQVLSGAWMSGDGSKFATAVSGITPAGAIYNYAVSVLANTVTTNSIAGSQSSAVELQYIGNGQFMPVSSAGTIWAN